MKILLRFGIALRLTAGFGFLVILMLCLTWLSVSKVSHINLDLGQINDVNSVKQRYAINYRGSVHDRAIAVRDVVLVDTPEARSSSIDVIFKLAAFYAENEKKMAATIAAAGATEMELSILTQIRNIQDRTNPVVAAIIASQQKGEVEDAKKILVEEAGPLFKAWLQEINKFIDFQEELNKSISTEVRETASGFQTVAWSAAAIAIALASAASLIASRSITRPMARLQMTLLKMAKGELDGGADSVIRTDEIGELARAVEAVRDSALSQALEQASREAARSAQERAQLEKDAGEQQARTARTALAVGRLGVALEEMANGRLDFRITETFEHDLDELRQNFNNAIAKLQSTVESIGKISQSIDGGAKEISGAAKDLTHRTEQQAASLEQTAAAIDEISTAVDDATKRAEDASSIVAQTRRSAEKSSEVVVQTIAAMGEIERSAGEISNIISVIDEIAFQTNLLALNAGVEAARAGDAGKGFAVVAQEVRELAQRSATAAKSIKQLINNSGEQVRSGVVLVGQTSTALNSIVSGVLEINDHVVSIVDSAHEQSNALREINTAINLLDQSVQKNAAMVEETSAASHSLAAESASLAALMAQFRGLPPLAGDRAVTNDPPRSGRSIGTTGVRLTFGNTALQRHDWREY